MRRTDVPPLLLHLLQCASRLSTEMKLSAVIAVCDLPYDFKVVQKELEPQRLLVASHLAEVQQAATEDGVHVVPLLHEPQSRFVQVNQAVLEALADGLLQTGARVVTLFPSFERENIDTISIINLSEQLTKLTTRDLQRLETQVPLETLRRVVDLAVEIGREGREGKPVGTLFVVGQHRKVLEMSHEGVHDPFRGYGKKERMIANPRVRESIKELAQLDGAFIISADGYVMAAGRILDAAAQELTLSKGLGARHWAAAGISKSTNAVAIAVSQSTGTVRLFQNGTVVLRIEPMDEAMKWHDADADIEAEAD
jgi:DNA integrity scanning protein DisA with diadenylate cyclase activity